MPSLVVKQSRVHGKGLFAGQEITEGDVVGICKTRRSWLHDGYTLWLEDAKNPVKVTCKLKYINHSKSPNVAYYDSLEVVALRDIRIGEELLHDYGEEWD